ncbi:MAG: class I SAM-dependent methyltransferase [Nanobdellota archaeon]
MKLSNIIGFPKRRTINSKPKILIFSPIKDFSEVASMHLSDFAEIYIADKLNDIFDYLKTHIFKVIIIILPSQMKNKNEYEKIFRLKDGSEKVNNLVILDQKQFAGVCIEKGADYFLITDNDDLSEDYESTMNGVYRGISSMNKINIDEFVKTLYNIMSRKPKQKIEDITKEKKYFYHKVFKIFDKRAKFTADKNKEIKFINKRLISYGAKNILDAGCGTGRLSIPLAELGFNVTGIDLSEDNIKKANKIKPYKNNNLTFIVGSLTTDVFQSREFDAILMMWHVICDFKGNHGKLMSKINSFLKLNGVVIIDFPDRMPNLQINEEGIYEDDAEGLAKYIGYVPELETFLILMRSKGFKIKEYKRLKWGIHKYVIVAQKAGYL